MSSSAFLTSADDRYFEDYVVGDVHRFGRIAVEEAEVISFARQFDPQPFHIDPDAAREGPFGGLIASGWHTAGLMMRLLTDHFLSSVASYGSPGIDELRWLRPVRPGDALSLRVTIREAIPSRSKPDRGMVRCFIEVLDQTGAVAMSLVAMVLVGRRPA
ncbi:MaoC family dehydratase [Telmatospirillum siberiense]|uniref:Acyl dehydratase n=1 Tax=Telmatospirillum siberiense TaxID=382514 RepID=A0A2N3PWS9_9PROT|nr:MaoC family dehydratase [Telmatospirillum siberiense]PKU24863.1 acyl dehydratase [Telmatospirillum siberiense]